MKIIQVKSHEGNYFPVDVPTNLCEYVVWLGVFGVELSAVSEDYCMNF